VALCRWSGDQTAAYAGEVVGLRVMMNTNCCEEMVRVTRTKAKKPAYFIHTWSCLKFERCIYYKEARIITKMEIKNEYKPIALKLYKEAEEIFGNAIVEREFANVYVQNKGLNTLYEANGKISICVSKFVTESIEQLYYQLGHEVCHLLHPSIEYPSGFKHTTLVINEGLSTYFSILAINQFGTAQETIEILKDNAPNYYNAFVAICELLDSTPDAIKLLRKIKPRIDTLKDEDFNKAGLIISTDLINKLLQPFIY